MEVPYATRPTVLVVRHGDARRVPDVGAVNPAVALAAAVDPPGGRSPARRRKARLRRFAGALCALAVLPACRCVPARTPACPPPSVMVSVRDASGAIEGAHVRVGEAPSWFALGCDFWTVSVEPAPEPDPLLFRLTRSSWRSGTAYARTDTQGRALLSISSSVGTVAAWIDDGEGMRVGEVPLSRSRSDPNVLDLVMQRVLRVEGRVVDEIGLPVVGVAVQAWAATDHRVERPSVMETTDEHGGFSLLSLGEGPQVVAVYGGVDARDGVEILDAPPTERRGIEGTRVQVMPDQVRDLILRVRRIPPKVIEVRGGPVERIYVTDVALHAPPHDVYRSFPSQSVSRRWTPSGSTFFVVVPEGTGHPWYVAHPVGFAPFVVPRTFDGVLSVTLERGRRISGTAFSTSRRLADATNRRELRYFVRRGAERICIGQGGVGNWSFDRAPTEVVEVAAFDLGSRYGSWVTIPEGDDDVTDVEVTWDESS